MWKATILVASTALFSLIGLLVEWNKSEDSRAFGAIVGCVGGFIIGYLSIFVAIASEKTK